MQEMDRRDADLRKSGNIRRTHDLRLSSRRLLPFRLQGGVPGGSLQTTVDQGGERVSIEPLIAVLVQALWPATAYQILVGVSLFGALFVWLMIFVTHAVFRRPALALGSYVGAAVIVAILVSTRWVSGLESTLIAGGPWHALLGIGYFVSTRRARR